MQVMLPIIDNDVCNQTDWHNGKLDDSMVCAGYEEGGLSNCHVSFHSDLSHGHTVTCRYDYDTTLVLIR